MKFFTHFHPLLLLLALTFPHAFSYSQSTLLSHWETRSPMPEKRSNMAAASLQTGDTTWIYCFMGIDSGKACGSGIRLEAFRYNTLSDQWTTLPDVPDTEGRIAASASAVNGKIYLIGGYKVFSNCNEFTSPRVDIYHPSGNTWTTGDSMITPVDDHVQVVWRDSIIITVSGWSQSTNTRRVQLYDTYLDTWTLSNDISGSGLFGHAGAIRGDTLLYLDGVRISGNFVLTNAVWRGIIQNSDPHTIQWTNLGTHPGARLYRGAGFTYQDRIIFTGGTDNAYNINGIGYNNQPSVESGRTWGYNLSTSQYEEYARNPDSAMDVRQVVPVEGNKFYVIGGMQAGQMVSDQVSVFVVDSAIVGKENPHNAELRIGPNPLRGDGFLRINAPAGVAVRMRVFDALGREMASWKLNGGESTWSPADHGLLSGIFFLQAEWDGQREIFRLVVH